MGAKKEEKEKVNIKCNNEIMNEGGKCGNSGKDRERELVGQFSL